MMTIAETDPPRTEASGRCDRRAALGLVGMILLSAVAVRAAYCVLVIPPGKGLTSAANDDAEYDGYALNLLNGRGMAYEDGRPSAQRLPGYPLFLAGVYGLFGHFYLAVRLIQCVIGAVSCLLLYLVMARWFSQRVGLVAAGILAVYPMHVWLSGELLSENLTILGLLLILLALCWARTGHGVGRWVLAGLAMAGAGLVHPIVAGAAMCLAGLTLALSIRTKPRRWPSALLMTTVLACPLLGWGVRNRIAVGGFVLSSDSGAVFLGANNVITATDPRCHGYWVGQWEIPGVWEQIGGDHDEVTRSKLFWQFALRWLWDHPRHWPGLAAHKLVRFYSPFLAEWRSVNGLVYLASYGSLLPLMLAGLWGTWRRGWSADRHGVRLLLTVLTYYAVMVMIFWGAPRFRLTIEPLLIGLAAVGIVQLASRLADRTATTLPIRRWQLRAHNV